MHVYLEYCYPLIWAVTVKSILDSCTEELPYWVIFFMNPIHWRVIRRKKREMLFDGCFRRQQQASLCLEARDLVMVSTRPHPNSKSKGEDYKNKLS